MTGQPYTVVQVERTGRATIYVAFPECYLAILYRLDRFPYATLEDGDTLLLEDTPATPAEPVEVDAASLLLQNDREDGSPVYF